MRRLSPMAAWLIFSGGHYFLRGGVFAVAPIYFVGTVGMNPLELVLAGTFMEAAAFLFEIPTGVVADAYSRRLSILCGVAIHGIAMIGMGLIPVTNAILGFWFLFGIGWTFLSGAPQAWIADELKQHGVDHALFRGQQAGLAGGFVGIGAGILVGSVSVELAMVSGGIVMLLMGAFMAFAMPEDHFAPAGDRNASAWANMFSTFREGVRQVRSRRILLILTLVAIVIGAASEGVDRLNEAHVLLNIALPEWPVREAALWIGLIRAGALLGSLAGTELLRRRTAHGDARTVGWYLAIATAVQSAGTIGFALSGHYWIAMGVFWVSQAARAGADTLYIAWVSRESDSRIRATVLSLCNQMHSVGEIGGGPLVGAIGVVHTLRTALATCGLILVPAVGIFARTARLQHRE